MSSKSLTFVRSSLFLAAAAVLAAPLARAQAGAVSSTPADKARPYSYVFLDPLEGQHTAHNDGSHVGVEMHGHWVINVKNPDGTVAEHRDFENTIQGYGQEMLISLMSGYAVPSDYGIYLTPSNGGTAPCPAPQGFQGCGIMRSTTTLPGSALCQYYTCALGLTYTPTLIDSGAGGSSLVLAGTITAANAGTIAGVTVIYGTCPANLSSANAQTSVAPTTCSTTAGSGGYRVLSAATVTTVNVVASQIVQVTVTFTFS